ncbi:MAG: AMP-binding protein [Muribaculaceae bacterium]|nr:AMP-binding protein [Muribaculaceae bacterium]
MPNILTHLTAAQANAYPSEREAFSTIDVEGRQLVPTGWKEFNDTVGHVACSLEILGLRPQETVCVFAPNIPEILYTDFACYRNRAIPVSIYATSSAEQVKYIINDASARA